jgi:hypothetical protein
MPSAADRKPLRNPFYQPQENGFKYFAHAYFCLSSKKNLLGGQFNFNRNPNVRHFTRCCQTSALNLKKRLFSPGKGQIIVRWQKY